jgi:hypothetical protein
MPRLFEKPEEREVVYKHCEILAHKYVAEFKRTYEKINGNKYSERFYHFIVFPYYFTIINFVYARHLYINKFMHTHAKEKFLITTFEHNLPRRFETKKEFLMNLYTNIDFNDWLASIIIENLGVSNVSIVRSEGKVNIFSISDAPTFFLKEFKSLLSSPQNIIKFYRIIFFLSYWAVKKLPYRIKSFQNIYGIGPLRSLLYSIILNVRAFVPVQPKKIEDMPQLKQEQDKNYFSSGLEKILNIVIHDTFPRSFDDFFAQNIKKIENENTFVPGKIRFDSTGFMDDQKSFLHGLSYLHGEKLAFSQHGSNYCTN